MQYLAEIGAVIILTFGIPGCGSSDSQSNAAQGGNSGQGGASQAGNNSTGATQADSANGGSGGLHATSAPGAGGNTNACAPTGSRLGVYIYGSCALNNAGKMRCWGSLPPSTETITPSTSTFTTMSAGWEGSCGITDFGGMECFHDPTQDGLEGQCGLAASGSIDCTNDPNFLTTGGSLAVKWAKVTGGGSTFCAVRTDGTPSCINVFPQPGTNVPFSDISVGQYHGCGIRRDTQELSCWTATFPPPPAGCVDSSVLGQNIPPSGQYVRVVSGWYHSCALSASGAVTCWGAGNASDTSGYDNCSTPQRYNYGQGTPPAVTFKALAAGAYTTCGIKTDDTIACWGAGTTTGDCQSDINTCGQALAPSGTFAEVAVGFSHACAMTAEGKVRCWGSNTGGRATPPAELQ